MPGDGGPRRTRARAADRIDEPGAWEISNRTVDAQGRAVSTAPGMGHGLRSGGGASGVREPIRECFARRRQGYRQLVTYQPATRFWTLQAIETAIFLALAAALTGFCFWWVRRLS